MPKEYCDILLFAIGTTAGLALGFLFALFILKDVPVISRRVRSRIGKGQKKKTDRKNMIKFLNKERIKKKILKEENIIFRKNI